jgi:hypothetical protein
MKIKSYAITVVPSKNIWGIGLELEDGSKPYGIKLNSATDLASLVDLLRHAKEPVFHSDSETIEFAFVPPGGLATTQTNDAPEPKFTGVLPYTGEDSE